LNTKVNVLKSLSLSIKFKAKKQKKPKDLSRSEPSLSRFCYWGQISKF